MSGVITRSKWKENTRRYLVYDSVRARCYMCVCAARDERHALKIARKIFTLERSAYAVLEAR